ncbi:hypothetical protein U1Q18_044625 [Sarracenia purpurea var. burkii]
MQPPKSEFREEKETTDWRSFTVSLLSLLIFIKATKLKEKGKELSSSHLHKPEERAQGLSSNLHTGAQCRRLWLRLSASHRRTTVPSSGAPSRTTAPTRHQLLCRSTTTTDTGNLAPVLCW